MVEHVVDTPLHEPDDEFVGGAPRLHEEFAGSCAISSADESAGTDEDLERVLFSVESRHEEVVVEVEHDDELRSANTVQDGLGTHDDRSRHRIERRCRHLLDRTLQERSDLLSKAGHTRSEDLEPYGAAGAAQDGALGVTGRADQRITSFGDRRPTGGTRRQRRAGPTGEQGGSALGVMEDHHGARAR